MERRLTYRIAKEQSGISISEFIKEQGFSHQVLVELKKTEQGILKNGVWARGFERLEEGALLELFLKETEMKETILPVDLKLQVVYEDDDILVVNKPANMPIHPSQNNYENTLANACMWYYRQKGETFVYRCINRLDRDTTGLVLLAKNLFSASVLSRQMANREIHRTYLAVVEGQLPQSGVIDAPIARKENSTIERCVDFEQGEAAVTHFERLQYRNGYSLARVWLDTGRTHQIRVHMNYIGHPLPGDYLYHPDFRFIDRQTLHSAGLEFRHPITGAELSFKAELPDDMKKILSTYCRRDKRL